MQAIILAAGMGKRLGELTQENTKCMVKVNGKVRFACKERVDAEVITLEPYKKDVVKDLVCRA